MATCSAVSVSSATGRMAARVASRESTTASAIPASASAAERPAQRAERVVDLGQRPRDEDRQAVGRRGDVHAHVGAFDLAIGEERRALALRDRSQLRVVVERRGQRRPSSPARRRTRVNDGRLAGQQHAVAGGRRPRDAAARTAASCSTWLRSESSTWSRSVSRTIQ